MNNKTEVFRLIFFIVCFADKYLCGTSRLGT